MRALTALSSHVVPYEFTDRPDPDDEFVQDTAKRLGVSPERFADFCEEIANCIWTKHGIRASLPVVIEAAEKTIKDKAKQAWRKLNDARNSRGNKARR